jgi:hypothetical protein
MSTEIAGAGDAGNGEMLLDQVWRVMRVKRYPIDSKRSYVDWIRRFVKFHGMKTTMIYTHILQQGGQGVVSPLDDLGV